MKIVTAKNGKKRIKISKNEWQSIGKKAGWMKTAGGFGKLGADLADALEGQVLLNKTKTPEEIFQIVKQDAELYTLIQQDGVEDQELLSYIEEMLRFSASSSRFVQ